VKKILLVSLFLIVSRSAIAGPIFPTRGFLLDPKWTGKTDTTSIFDHAGYWAEVQRGFGSDSDRWAWSVSMGAIWEFARWGGDKSLFGFTGMELIANNHNDIDFKPRGAMWEEGLVYAVHENSQFDWQVGTIYRCRHDIDNIDPNGYSDINQQRTLIYCSLSGKAIFRSDKLFGLDCPTTSWLHADAYLVREDYRIPTSDDYSGTDFQDLAWSLGPAFQSKLVQWDRSSLYLMINENFTAFGRDSGFVSRFSSIAKLTADSHAELGYELHGRAGRMQFYAGWEEWQDDGQTPIPRNAKYVTLGVRTTGVDLVSF
jgi:hypothetical protein